MFFILENGDYLIAEGGDYLVTEDHVGSTPPGDTGGGGDGCYILLENGDILVTEGGDPFNAENCTPAVTPVSTGKGAGGRRRPSRVFSAYTLEDEPTPKLRVEIVDEKSEQITPIEWTPSGQAEIDEVMSAFLASAGDMEKAMEESAVLAQRLRQAQRRRNQQRILMMILT